MQGEEGTNQNANDYSKKKKLDVKMLVEAEDSRKEWEDTRIAGEKEQKDK